jgi:RNA polymerase sigma-70 factor, ECF subfamily
VEASAVRFRDRAIRGREKAVAELFAADYPRLAGWCRRLVDDVDIAHEIAAEAFARLWSRWSRVDDPRGFLYVTATNLVRDHWRKTERHERAMSSVRALAHAHQPAPALDPDPDLRSLVQALPDRLRAPVLLHYYADLPVRDVALLLRRNENTIKSDLHRARGRLRDALEGHR